MHYMHGNGYTQMALKPLAVDITELGRQGLSVRGGGMRGGARRDWASFGATIVQAVNRRLHYF
jgi:hypothetical protein